MLAATQVLNVLAVGDFTKQHYFYKKNVLFWFFLSSIFWAQKRPECFSEIHYVSQSK